MKSMPRNTLFLLLLVFSANFFSGCKEDVFEQEKYQPPEWMKGKIFSQLQKEEDLTSFVTCLEKSGYDTIMDVSGSYTVFAPTNEAFEAFFQQHPGYNSLSDMSAEELETLVEYQIIYNAWSKEQFQSLNVSGWVDPNDPLSEPRAYKRKTLLRGENKSYPVKRVGNRFQIVRESEATENKKAFTQSNKYAPIFFDEFMAINDLTGSDYEYYFNRPFNSSNLYFAQAQLHNQIPAENGFIYKTDQVVSPLPNGEEIMEVGYQGHTYEKFLNLVHEFSEFHTNLEATYNQPGVEQGLEVDTLYNVRYPELVFNIHNELTGNTNDEKFTVRDHHGLMAPTDEAFEQFLNEYLSGWGGLEGIPRGTKEIIVNSHMSPNPVYPKDMSRGFLNGESDRVWLSEGQIIQKTYGSNCSFLGLNQAIVPRVIKSVCRPMYITRNFVNMKYAVEDTKVLSALKKPEADYAFYLPSDAAIGYDGDSSLILNITNPDLNRFNFRGFDRGSGSFERYETGDLKAKILNQIGTANPEGVAKKEFIRNLGGNYIVVNNEQGTVRGSGFTRFGMNGDSTIQLTPEPYPEQTDNGKIYEVKGFFNYSTINTYYGLFTSKYSRFLNLLEKAGLYDPIYYDFPFLIDGEYYTVFIPSDQALDDYGVDDLSMEELRDFLKYHFVRRHLIFTDGKKSSGYYATTREDERSTQYTTQYSNMYIRPQTDVIEILDKNGDTYLEIPEEEGRTNQMIMYDPNDESESRWDYMTTGVVHEIDQVLIKDSLQAK